MKVIFPYKEAAQILRLKFNLLPDAQVVIGRPSTRVRNVTAAPVALKDNSMLAERFRVIEEFINGGHALSAIKQFRAYTASGLKEAKHAIENWEITKNHSRNRGRLAIPTFNTLVASDYPDTWR